MMGFVGLTTKRGPALVIGGTGIVFITTFAVLATGTWSLPAFLLTLPHAACAALTATFAALLVASALSALGNRMLRRHAKHMRTALNSMAQGLCMFDAAERLVVCNTRYYEMYGLIESDVPPGVTLSQVLARRVAKGTFSRDPEKYRQEFLDEVRKGRTILHEVKTTDGRVLRVMNHPLRSGGWIGTHEDITQRREAELKLTAMQETEQRRATVEGAIAAFRKRIDRLLQSVVVRAGDMRETATGLFGAFDTTAQRAGSAVQRSNSATVNVDNAASSANELAASVVDIGGRVGEAARMVRQTVDEMQATNADMQLLSQAAQRIDDVIKLIRNIAGQTNLLALNATIEAARAGEAGRGFAVVASEVKSLAVQTGKATEDISAQILAVQQSTDKAAAAIERVAQRMDEINAHTTAVAASVEQQTAATNDIFQNVTGAADATKLIVSVLGEVAGAAAETQKTAQSVLDAAQSVEGAAGEMRAEVEDFLTKVAM